MIPAEPQTAIKLYSHLGLLVLGRLAAFLSSINLMPLAPTPCVFPQPQAS